ncbi:hypothetical protein LCGC14_2248280, partial [marine sediment metagenome]
LRRSDGPSNFKKAYEELYGLFPDAEFIRGIAIEMAERASPPTELVELMDKVERLTL